MAALDVLPGGLRPLRDWVLVLPDGGKERRRSGLFLPPSAQPRQCTGVVVGCGGGVSFDLAPGDRVAFLRRGSEGPFRLADGQEYLFLRERGVLFRLDDGAGGGREGGRRSCD